MNHLFRHYRDQSSMAKLKATVLLKLPMFDTLFMYRTHLLILWRIHTLVLGNSSCTETTHWYHVQNLPNDPVRNSLKDPVENPLNDLVQKTAYWSFAVFRAESTHWSCTEPPIDPAQYPLTNSVQNQLADPVQNTLSDPIQNPLAPLYRLYLPTVYRTHWLNLYRHTADLTQKPPIDPVQKHSLILCGIHPLNLGKMLHCLSYSLLCE